MGKTAGIIEFLTRNLLDIAYADEQAGYIIKSVTQYGLLVADRSMKLSAQELSDFQDRMVAELQDEFCISERRAQEEVSWFIDRCVRHE